MNRLLLPTRDGRLEPHDFAFPAPVAPSSSPSQTRRAYAAVHVVADPLRASAEDTHAPLDLDATLAFRHHIWACGLGVAEAMDTAQRGMGLDWPAARELIGRSAAEARSVGGAIIAGATTDQLPAGAPVTLAQVTAAYVEQAEAIEAAGSRIAVMPSRHLAAVARSADDYLEVYDSLIEQCAEPIVLHWLGPAFDPALAAYWGSHDVELAADVVVDLCARHAERIDGIKVSLLDASFEERLRSRLPDGVGVYTGDDFDYPSLIRGDETAYSDALLGVFDPLAPVAAHALAALDRGDTATYEQVFAPTVPFARHLFEAPTRAYKVGIGFIAWLNGHQDHFRMLGGIESARSVTHLAELLRLADRAGVLREPDLALERSVHFLEVAGIRQVRP